MYDARVSLREGEATPVEAEHFEGSAKVRDIVSYLA
jgi:hypothetical protein